MKLNSCRQGLRSRIVSPWALRLAVAGVIGLGCATLVGRADDAPKVEAKLASPLSDDLRLESGISQPSDEFKLNFRGGNGPGVVGEVLVKEGDRVKKGQVLAVADTREEAHDLAILQADVELGQVAVKAAKATLAQKQVELTRVKKIFDDGGGNDAEYEKAKLDVDLAAIDIEKADVETKGAQAKLEKTKEHIELMKITSPDDGWVQKCDLEPGEIIDPNKPSELVVVKNDPLKVEFHLPTAQSRLVKLGQAFRVSYDKNTWFTAKVTYMAPYADAAAGIQTIHMDMLNPDQTASGMQVFVELPEDVVALRAKAVGVLAGINPVP